jgi:hypothetical protein
MPTRRLPATIGLCLWTLLVWTTRIANIWNDAALSDAEKLRSTGLALSFTVLVAVVGHAVYHRTSWRDIAVKALAGWTIGVWTTRSVGIATGDHEAAFIAVHLVLAAVSTVLAVLAVRESARLSPVSATADEPAGDDRLSV